MTAESEIPAFASDGCQLQRTRNALSREYHAHTGSVLLAPTQYSRPRDGACSCRLPVAAAQSCGRRKAVRAGVGGAARPPLLLPQEEKKAMRPSLPSRACTSRSHLGQCRLRLQRQRIEQFGVADRGGGEGGGHGWRKRASRERAALSTRPHERECDGWDAFRRAHEASPLL